MENPHPFVSIAWAHLREQLTLNQWDLGSIPRKLRGEQEGVVPVCRLAKKWFKVCNRLIWNQCNVSRNLIPSFNKMVVCGMFSI